MSEAQSGGQAADTSQSGKGNATRIVLVSILVVAIAVLILDRRARSACTDLHDDIAKMVESADSPTVEQVHEKIGRDADNIYLLTDGRVVEQYVWASLVREYSLYTYATPGVGEFDYVAGVTLNTLQNGVNLDTAKKLSKDELAEVMSGNPPTAAGDTEVPEATPEEEAAQRALRAGSGDDDAGADEGADAPDTDDGAGDEGADDDAEDAGAGDDE